MEKQKIMDMVERHTSLDSAKKDLMNFKTLLGTTECKISQYQTQLSTLERYIEEDEKNLKQKKEKAYKEAEELIKLIYAEFEQRKNDYEKKFEEEKENLDRLIKTDTIDKKEFEKNLDATNNALEQNTEKYNEIIETLQNKINIFNRKQKEKEIQQAKEEQQQEEEKLIKHKNYVNNCILKTDDIIHVLEQKKIEKAADYTKKITDIAKDKKNVEEIFNKQYETFNHINSDTDLNELSYFNSFALKDIVTLIINISNRKEKKQETLVMLEDSQKEKEDILHNIEDLNNKVNTVLKEREELKEKITTTKENIGNQLQEKMNTMKTVITSAFNYEEEKEEEKESPKAESLEDLINKIIEKESYDHFDDPKENGSDGAKKEDSNEEKEGNDTVGDILNGFLNGNPEEAAESLIKKFLGKRK